MGQMHCRPSLEYQILNVWDQCDTCQQYNRFCGENWSVWKPVKISRGLTILYPYNGFEQLVILNKGSSTNRGGFCLRGKQRKRDYIIQTPYPTDPGAHVTTANITLKCLN